LLGGCDVGATLLVIDNYDSFTYNLVQMFRQFPLQVQVHRSDKIGLDQVADLAPDYILISPGPKDPLHAGISMPVIKAWHAKVPILGVCLGMQCLNEVFGGRTIRSPQPLHGKTSAVYHDGRGLFEGLPSPFNAARYHSLAIEPDPCTLQGELTITARTRDGSPEATATTARGAPMLCPNTTTRPGSTSGRVSAWSRAARASRWMPARSMSPPERPKPR